MTLEKDDIEKIYFLTHTLFGEKQIINFARYANDFYGLLDKIRKLRYTDLDRDWVLFDYCYRQGRIFYAKNIRVIDEKDIFKGTYIHLCRNDFKYLIQVTGKSGYCRNCDTQFFPKVWWDNPFREKTDYNAIKYGGSINLGGVELDKKYLIRLLKYGVNPDILNDAVSVIHSPAEIEKALNTRNYDRHNPPPPVKIHGRLLFLYDIWTVRPVKRFGVYPGSKYFFHKCHDNIERILFDEKNLYPWCPACFTKFIPESDRETVEKYRDHIEVATYVYGGEKPAEENREDAIDKSSPEFFYLSILGFNKRVEPGEILNTFRKLSKVYHPDLGGSSETFQEIVNAKNWLVKYYNSFGKF